MHSDHCWAERLAFSLWPLPGCSWHVPSGTLTDLPRRSPRAVLDLALSGARWVGLWAKSPPTVSLHTAFWTSPFRTHTSLVWSLPVWQSLPLGMLWYWFIEVLMFMIAYCLGFLGLILHCCPLNMCPPVFHTCPYRGPLGSAVAWVVTNVIGSFHFCGRMVTMATIRDAPCVYVTSLSLHNSWGGCWGCLHGTGRGTDA